MVSVQAPGGTAWLAEYGDPPVIGSERPSHASSQDTSLLNESLLTVISEGLDSAGGEGDEGISGGAGC
jgi:hypothetical protein